MGRTIMIHSLLVLLLLSLCLVKAANDLPFPYETTHNDDAESSDNNNNNALSFTQFVKILRTEAGNDQKRGEVTWNITQQYAWNHTQQRVLQSSSESSLTSPFVICDTTIGKTGEDAQIYLQSLLGTTNFMIPLYNRKDMTCFAVQLIASDLITTLPRNIKIAPLTPEMKMGRDLINHILTSNPVVSNIETIFCGAKSIIDIDVTDIINRLTKNRKQRQRSLSFYSNVYNWQHHRHLVENTNDDDDFCHDMIELMETEVSGDTMVLKIIEPGYYQNETYRECIRDIVIDLALFDETCFVWAYQNTQSLNLLATSTIQGGTTETPTPLYDVGLDGTGQIVALSDTGIDINNCYFWDAQREVSKEQSNIFDLNIRKVIQYYTHADSTDVKSGHGTHVAGTLAGRKAQDGDTEVDGIADGIARGAKIAFFDIGEASGRLRNPLPDTLFAPGAAAGAKVHSVSWGSPYQNFYTGYDRAIDKYMYLNPDFLFVAAAGNEGNDDTTYTVGSPAICKNGLSVGASHSARTGANGPTYLAEFSSRGPTRDGRQKPDIVAPGRQILSARALPDESGECDGSGTFYKSGTSMAAPIVAASAILVRQYFEEGWHITGSPVPENSFLPKASLVKAVLLNGAQALEAVQDFSGKITTTTEAYDVHQGFGRVDLLKSLPLKDKNFQNGIFVNGKVIKNGELDTYTIKVTNLEQCGPLSATLVWTDPMGAPNCNECVLNDLDLYLVKNGGSIRIFPNGLDEADTVNNAERVQIYDNIVGDIYTINVAASDLIRDQEYSLVITGCFTETDDAIPGEGSDATSCADGSTIFDIGDGTLQDCSWLQSNLINYSYLCAFSDVAAECPITCQSCSAFEENPVDDVEELSAVTDLQGKNRWFGNMFDIQAKRDLILQGYDVHFNAAGTYQLFVYAKAGQRSSSSTFNDDWDLLCEATVESDGYGSLTSIPESLCMAQPVSTNEWLTLYVTTIDPPDLVVNDMKGDLITPRIDNNDIKLRSGAAVTYGKADSQSFEGFGFDGGIHYSVITKRNGNNGQQEQCADQSGVVLIDSIVGERSCNWLSQHLSRFDYACEFFRVSNHCRRICHACVN